MSTLLPAQIDALVAAGAPRHSSLLMIGTDPVTRFWYGPGKLRLAADDAVDPNGLYYGVGALQDLPSFRQPTGGVAERLDFTFFADHPAIVAMMALGVHDKPVRVAEVYFDDGWQMAGPAAWLLFGTSDVSRLELNAGIYYQVLSVITGAAKRAKAHSKYMTNARHQMEHPGDRFFDRVQGLTVNTVRRFG